VRVVPSEGDVMVMKIVAEIERILEEMRSTTDTVKLREYALTIESLVISLSRIK
jgi:hypothetical protein